MTDLTLGAEVEVTAKLVRKVRHFRKTWEREELPEPLTGTVVGTRLRQNGYTDTHDWFWVRTSTVPVVLVATSLHRLPLNVLREDLEIIDPWHSWELVEWIKVQELPDGGYWRLWDELDRVEGDRSYVLALAREIYAERRLIDHPLPRLGIVPSHHGEPEEAPPREERGGVMSIMREEELKATVNPGLAKKLCWNHMIRAYTPAQVQQIVADQTHNLREVFGMALNAIRDRGELGPDPVLYQWEGKPGDWVTEGSREECEAMAEQWAVAGGLATGRVRGLAPVTPTDPKAEPEPVRWQWESVDGMWNTEPFQPWAEISAKEDEHATGRIRGLIPTEPINVRADE